MKLCKRDNTTHNLVLGKNGEECPGNLTSTPIAAETVTFHVPEAFFDAFQIKEYQAVLYRYGLSDADVYYHIDYQSTLEPGFLNSTDQIDLSGFEEKYLLAPSFVQRGVMPKDYHMPYMSPTGSECAYDSNCRREHEKYSTDVQRLDNATITVFLTNPPHTRYLPHLLLLLLD